MSILLLNLHEFGVALFVFFSVISLVLIVSKPVAKEFEATALEWIRTFKRIKEEWRKPLPVDSAVKHSQFLNETDRQT